MSQIVFIKSTDRNPSVKHYEGLPPSLTGGRDDRRLLDPAQFLIIEEHSDGIFLYRYDAQGSCVGDTWHSTVDDAKAQAAYEFSDSLESWRDVPPEIADAVTFGVRQVKQLP
jgi:hypothetical protein